MVRYRDSTLLCTVEGDPPVRVFAVGWLGWLTFRLGPTPQRFQDLLDELCRRPPVATATPGSHPCLLGRCRWRWWFGRSYCGGSAEIVVPGRGGVVYLAPMLIAHYVRVHRYRPPREFIEAVLALDGPGGLRWDDVRRVARRLWGNDDGLADARPGCT